MFPPNLLLLLSVHTAKALLNLQFTCQYCCNQFLTQRCTYLELLEAGKQMAGLLKITPIQQKHFEEMTRGQSKSKFWLCFRSGRVTASRFHQVVHTNPYKPALSLVHNICYPESTKFSSEATQYGCDNENRAIEAYKQRWHKSTMN